MKILMCASECAPFVKTGGLGDVVGSLPKELANQGVDVRVVMPKYQVISQEFKEQMKFLGNIYVPVGWRSQYCGVFSLILDNVTYYFLDNEYYFNGDCIYGDYDLEKFAFFSRAVLEILPLIDFEPDCIHCHDWQTAILPAIYDAIFKGKEKYKDIKTIFTIHNLKFQGVHNIEFANDVLGLPWSYFSNDKIGRNSDANFMKGGIVFANYVTTVSPTYAEEIKTQNFGEGLDWALKARGEDLKAILNGIDYTNNSPETSPYIAENYNADNFVDRKWKSKIALQRRMNWQENPNIPIISMVTRLTSQKGLDLVLQGMDRLMRRKMQFVILGTGDRKYEDALRYFADRYGDKFRACICFDNELAHQIYAGSDMFLMPSGFEPCGLGQMIALNFGSLPIVHETGGLKDTIHSYNEETGEGNGFSFTPFNAHNMIYTIDRALGFYNSPLLWQKIVRQAMVCDYSWGKSAKKYIELYEELVGNKEKGEEIGEEKEQQVEVF